MLPREESRPRPTCEDAADVSLSHNYKHDAASLSALPPPLCPSHICDVASPPRLIYSFNNAESYVNSRSAPEMEVYESRRAEPNRWRKTGSGTLKILKALLFPWRTGMHRLKERLAPLSIPTTTPLVSLTTCVYMNLSLQNSSLLLSAESNPSDGRQ